MIYHFGYLFIWIKFSYNIGMIKKFELVFDAKKKNKKIDFNNLSFDILYFYYKKKNKNIIKKK